MADQNMSTRTAGGLTAGHRGRSLESGGDAEDVVNRQDASTTPRRYEQPLEDDDDPVMPSGESSLNTKI